MYSLLHCHFESALRALSLTKPGGLKSIRTVYESSAYRYSEPAERLDLLWRKILSLTDDDDMFSEAIFRRVVQRFLDEMESAEVEHIDLRIGPSTGRWKWMTSAADGLDVFREELKSRDGISVAFLAGVNMEKSDSQLGAIFDTLTRDSAVLQRISGVDVNFLPGDIAKFNRYLRTLRELQGEGLKLNIHLGELFDNELSSYVLSCIKPDRIGHGVLLLRDEKLVDIVREHGICLDMCPTSNTLLGVVDWRYESPARRALQLGIAVSINTDDPVLFGANIAHEYRLARLMPEQREAVMAYSKKYRYDPL